MEQYISMLQGVCKYEKSNLQIICVLFSVTLVILFVSIVRCFKKEKVLNRIIMCSILAVFCIAFGLYLFDHYRYQQALQLDMDQGTFVSYTGTFVHDDYQRDSFYHNFYIYPNGDIAKQLRYPDYGNQYFLHSENQVVPVGTWTGTVVYGKNSNVVVYCSTEGD